MVTLGCLLSTPKAGLQRFSNEDTGKIVRSLLGGHQASSTPGNGWPGGSRTTRVDTRPALGAVIKGVHQIHLHHRDAEGSVIAGARLLARQQ
ncbi:hypothetical protein PCASD_21261 [Puccinia coronata f. sp. avenae]|uniref:Uncharacterized protein n=1 Tax=Puccinia coronata f. sp. avenae TaxID=200324 RepID=A0A2N5U2H8_9BASI|nr:hypothetical protein PCASD_21261 [Puccinia coronata f. sp. avenae]